MTPQEFLNKWRQVELKERSASQSNFNDLSALLGVLDPIAADPKGEWFPQGLTPDIPAADYADDPRAQAIATGTVQRFTVAPDKRAWTGAKQHGGELPSSLEVKFIGVRQVQEKRGEGVILFFEDGASTGGRIQLKHERAVWNVDVAWLTGEVSLHRGEAGR